VLLINPAAADVMNEQPQMLFSKSTAKSMILTDAVCGHNNNKQGKN
jgi:hypothetical protein